jgi:hypothetical protein
VRCFGRGIDVFNDTLWKTGPLVEAVLRAEWGHGKMPIALRLGKSLGVGTQDNVRHWSGECSMECRMLRCLALVSLDAFLAILPGAAESAIRIEAPETGVTVRIEEGGVFDIATARPSWRFSGSVGAPLFGLGVHAAADLSGNYQQLDFKFQSADGGMRLGSIRLYDRQPVVAFDMTYVTPGHANEPFPSISRHPVDLHHLSYTAIFGGFSVDELGSDGPWVFFDDQANTAILSPAAHFMNARLALGPHGEWTSAIDADPPDIPAGFRQSTVLVIEPGINRAFETWGRYLTGLAGKVRPPNDADFGLKYLGYWTDHGAQYYYRSEPGLDYEGTLLAVRDEFERMGIRLGYVQLDSWFYPKGNDARWKSADPLGGGTYVYEASNELFPHGLAAFQARLGLPLITHNRWIDANSPYRLKYQLSANVAVDPELWAAWMRYARSSGVRTYEQDWLSGPATPQHDLTSGERFMDLMADAAAYEGISLQYCMPLPRHFLQGTRYSNLLTIRTSGDRFDKDQWKPFLFNGRLASALGEWPWTDVFKSGETSNLLLATLSAGMVGTGDAIGRFDRANLLRAARPDGLIVKPDSAIAPLDSTYVEAAHHSGAPLVASAKTHRASGDTTYLFALRDDGAAPDNANPAERRRIAIMPAALGYAGPVYAYSYFDEFGMRVHPSESFDIDVPPDGAYWIIVPIGPSGIGLVGDPDKFVSDGRNRIARRDDDGEMSVRVMFAEDETRITLHGFSSMAPDVRVANGSFEALKYDPQTGRFRFAVSRGPGGWTDIVIRAQSGPENRR